MYVTLSREEFDRIYGLILPEDRFLDEQATSEGYVSLMWPTLDDPFSFPEDYVVFKRGDSDDERVREALERIDKVADASPCHEGCTPVEHAFHEGTWKVYRAVSEEISAIRAELETATGVQTVPRSEIDQPRART